MTHARLRNRLLVLALPVAVATTVIATSAQNTSKADAEFFRRAYDTYQSQRNASSSKATTCSPYSVGR